MKALQLSVFPLLLLMSPTVRLSAQTSSLEEVLAKMDQQGAGLRSMSARITQKKWTHILEEFDKGESGYFYFLRERDQVFLRKDVLKPQENTLIIRQGTVWFYQPRIKQAQRYNLGRNRDKAEFLLLGFGSHQEALKETYKIQLLKQESIDGRQTYVLELTPRSDQVSAYFSKIVLWVDAALWVPIQQKLVEPNHDYLLIRFDDIKLNDRISRSRFDVKLPREVKVIGSS